MHAVETHVQPLEGQQRQLRHHHHQDPQTNGARPALATEEFPMADTQGAFSYAAEPAPLLFDDSMAVLPPSSTPGQESMYTPNLASSFDSALHPDRSYPPQNAHGQTQNHRLSPGSFYGNGQNISPSHSVDHLSPEAGYMSDPNHQDPSTYTAPPNFSAQVLDDFSGLTFAENGVACTFPSYQSDVDMSMLTSSSLNTYNAQLVRLVNNAPLDPRHQLLSPSATHTSSPAVGDDSSVFLPTMHYNGMLPTPPKYMTHMQYPAAMNQTQSPALTNSPGPVPLANPKSHVRHVTSPIVRVENYSREESPLQSSDSRSISKRSFDSRRSGNHLSPYPQVDSSDEEGHHERVCIQPEATTHVRNEDGSWTTRSASGQTGLSPDDRQALGNAYMPSIDDIADQWAKNSKKLEVHEWLAKSEVGSEAGDEESSSSNSFLKPVAGRRRAKSTNDVQRRDLSGNYGLGVHIDFDHMDDSGIPGPGIYIEEQSEYGDEEDEEASDEPESPPAAIDYQTGQPEPSYFPMLQDPVPISDDVVRPWVDTPSQSPTPSARYQPPTSNAAMMRFWNRAKDIESASLAATVGSRRLSESDLGSIRAAPGVATLIESDPKKQKDRQRRPSFLEQILPKRAPNNLKRKTSVPVQPLQENGQDKSKDPIIEKPKRIGSWGRPKSPRVDSNLSSHSKESGPPSHAGFSTGSGPWFRAPKYTIKRSRSRSDIGRSPGLAELMTQHGGPPMPMLASPLADTEATKPSIQPSPAGEDEDDEAELVTMDLKVRTDPIIPSYEGFRTHARQLNPRLTDFMVERITQEQMRRYKRLLDFRVKHLNAVKSHNCSSGKFCTDLGGEAMQLPPRAGHKDSDAPFVGFQITAPGSSDDDGESGPEGTVIAAQFPSGVPLPPVKRLPAEFECPLCFKVKKFYKPSDWTKHVHEDVQPFTCTFPSCGDAKSFKRKADWVRHENERHRQLENWTCQISDCNHTCYRKDNFVQHLVREHKITEPRQRSGRVGHKDSTASADPDDIWAMVERCRQDTTKQPKDEPCRFCGNICTSWKKLTVHLAKHMEQISMPILTLVEQRVLNADSVISPVVELPESRKLCVAQSQPPIDSNPSRYYPNSTYAPGIDPGSFPLQEIPSMVTSQNMHTYPPPQMSPYKAPRPVQAGGYSNYSAGGSVHYPNQTYPGLQAPAKPRNGYANDLVIPSMGYPTGTMQNNVSQYSGNSINAAHQPYATYTDSPIDTTTFPPYYTDESQNLTNHMPVLSYDATNEMQYPQSNPHPPVPHTNTQQQTYYYHQNQ